MFSRASDTGSEASDTGSEESDAGSEGSRSGENQLPGEFVFQGAGLTKPQVSNGQSKGHAQPNFADAANSQSDPTPNTSVENSSPDLSSVTAARLPSAQADGQGGRGSASIGEQILESIHSSLRQGGQEIIIRLNPPELGKVFLRFHEQQDSITGLLEVSRAQTRYEIEHALPEVIRALQDSGIQVSRFEVELADQPQQQLLRDQSSPEGSLGQNGFADRGDTDDKSAAQLQASDSSYGVFDEPQIQVTNDSISILA
jgi:flagellar hook-length control protein FliK